MSYYIYARNMRTIFVQLVRDIGSSEHKAACPQSYQFDLSRAMHKGTYFRETHFDKISHFVCLFVYVNVLLKKKLCIKLRFPTPVFQCSLTTHQWITATRDSVSRAMIRT